MKKFFTSSDAGAVKVGLGESFNIDIPNGYGDGTTTVYVYEHGEEFDPFNHGYNLALSLRGKLLSVYDYDCCKFDGTGVSAEEVCKLSGEWFVFTGKKSVVFKAVNEQSEVFNG